MDFVHWAGWQFGGSLRQCNRDALGLKFISDNRLQ